MRRVSRLSASGAHPHRTTRCQGDLCVYAVTLRAAKKLKVQKPNQIKRNRRIYWRGISMPPNGVSQPCGAFHGRTEALSGSVEAQPQTPAMTASKASKRRRFTPRSFIEIRVRRLDAPEKPHRPHTCRPASSRERGWQCCDPFGRCEQSPWPPACHHG